MSAGGPSPSKSTLPNRVDASAPGVRNRLRFLIELFSATAERFSDNEGYRLGAAFSYYCTFSIFPLLLLSITIVGFILGDSASARERLLEVLSVPGSPMRDLLDRTLTAMQESRSARGVSAVIGVGTLLFGASGAFVELDAALNRIWCVPERESKGLLGSIRVFLLERLSGFAIVLGLGLTLLVSLVASSLLSILVARAEEEVSLSIWPAIGRGAELALSMTLLCAGARRHPRCAADHGHAQRAEGALRGLFRAPQELLRLRGRRRRPRAHDVDLRLEHGHLLRRPADQDPRREDRRGRAVRPSVSNRREEGRE